MKHRELMTTLLVACLAGCGSSKPPTSPVAGSDTSKPEVTAPTAAEPASSEPKSAEPAASPAATSAPAAAAENPCKKLKKGTCKVTRGCAWRDGKGGGCIQGDGLTEEPADAPSGDE